MLITMLSIMSYSHSTLIPAWVKLMNHNSINDFESKGLTKFKEFWTESEITQLSRIFDGIFAALLSLRRYPMIRFLGASNACAALAEKLNVIFLIISCPSEHFNSIF